MRRGAWYVFSVGVVLGVSVLCWKMVEPKAPVEVSAAVPFKLNQPLLDRATSMQARLRKLQTDWAQEQFDSRSAALHRGASMSELSLSARAIDQKYIRLYSEQYRPELLTVKSQLLGATPGSNSVTDYQNVQTVDNLLDIEDDLNWLKRGYVRQATPTHIP